MEQEPKKKKLTKKQRGFVNDYVETGVGAVAARKNYNIGALGGKNEAIVASMIANENLKKPYIMEAIESKRKSLKQALIDKGITEDYLADKVDVLLQATDLKGKEDYTAIDKGLKHATSIYGVVSEPERTQGNTYNFIFSGPVQEKVRLIEAEIKGFLTKKPNV